ncbi:hypothetical protein MKY41_00420 [Sporosarcina sp. FSL W7-1349]|uniref:hypothetical protein n=1 Tax=Sporosarcina sp. FSL W7-1349 TaxID=2921561 RepID=UPI0030F61900
MDSRLWKIGFFTALTSFVLLILGVRTIGGHDLIWKNYATFSIFSLTVGVLASVMLFYKLTIAFRIFMGALVLGFLQFFRSFLMGSGDFSESIGILDLFIISSFGFGLALLIQFGIIFMRQAK